MEISIEVPQKAKNRTPYDPAIPVTDIELKECKSTYNRDICMPIFKAALLTMAKLCNQSRCPSMDD
jgi:hypothetical protein